MIKIHCGCGKRFIPGWHHVDGESFPHVHEHDVTLKDKPSDSVDVIYSAHLLEYFSRNSAFSVLKGWHRVLKPFGILRIAVPDFEALCYAYRIRNFPIENLLGPLYGEMMMGDKVIRHHTAYDFKSLKELLLSAGFKNIHKYDWRETEHAHIDDHSQAYLPHMDKQNGLLISLNVEATKP